MKNLSCLEADVLIYIFAWGDDNGVNEDELISDYLMNLSDLPVCCFDASNVLRICNHCLSSSDDKEYSDAQMNMIIKYVLIQLKNKGLIKEKDNHYTTTVEYDDITNLLKNKSSNCSCFHNYVKEAFDYLQDELTYILGDGDDDHDEAVFEEALSSSDEVAPIIRQSILSNTSDKEISKILNHFANAHVITMSSSGKPYKFLPLFATVVENNIYFILSPNFKNEFGEDKTALVFKRNEDQSFTIVTDKTTETIFELYQAAKERDINGK